MGMANCRRAYGTCLPYFVAAALQVLSHKVLQSEAVASTEDLPLSVCLRFIAFKTIINLTKPRGSQYFVDFHSFGSRVRY